jgi:hypothetical protein
MDRKRIIELSRRARAEAERENKKPESQKGTAPQIDKKNWKKTLAVEWLWFLLTLLVSWLVSNILEFYIPVGIGLLTMIIFGLVYVVRLTSWAITQAGKE